jgi:hypothetical protein
MAPLTSTFLEQNAWTPQQAEAANNAPTGTASWWNENADKLLSVGQAILKTVGLVPGETSTAATTKTSQSVTVSNLEGYLPWILGGIAVVGIGFILWKR